MTAKKTQQYLLVNMFLLCLIHFLGIMLRREQNYDKNQHVFLHVIDNIKCFPLIYEYTTQ